MIPQKKVRRKEYESDKKLSFLAAAALIACPSGFTTLAADGTDGYRDVEPAAWYYEAVDWARVNGIIGGDGNVFDPQGKSQGRKQRPCSITGELTAKRKT